MTQDPRLPTSENTIRATSVLLGFFPQVTGFVVGFSGLAYITGWRELSAYYQVLGAPWILPILPASQIMQTSIWLITLITAITFFSVLSLVEGTASQKGLRKWAIIFLIFGGVLYVGPIILEPYISLATANFIATATSIVWAISAGLTIGELIACLALNQLKWGDYEMVLIYFIVFYGFMQAPSNMGKTRAELDSHVIYSKLPKVSFISTASFSEWRLVGPSGDKLLLVLLSKKPEDRRFKLVSPDVIGEIAARRSHLAK